MLSASHARVARHLPDESALIDGDPDADSAKVARRVAEATMHSQGWMRSRKTSNVQLV
jgi:hypothetical protein